MVVVRVAVDDIDAFAVSPAVEDSPPGRRPGNRVLGVGVGRDDVEASRVGVDDAERRIPIAEAEPLCRRIATPKASCIPSADQRGPPPTRPVGSGSVSPHDEDSTPTAVGDLVASGRPCDVASGFRIDQHRLSAVDPDDIELRCAARRSRVGVTPAAAIAISFPSGDQLRPMLLRREVETSRLRPMPSRRTSQSERCWSM